MLIKQNFHFDSINADRPLHIRIPDHGEGPFPVFYFFDGHNLFRDEDATYGKSWGLDEFCASWDKQIIIVGIECGHGHERTCQIQSVHLKGGMPFTVYRERQRETLA